MKIPTPMTLETTIAAASSGPRRRSRKVRAGAITGLVGDQRTGHWKLTEFHPLDRSVFREELDPRVHEMRIRQHLLPRLIRPGVAEVRFDRQRVGRRAASQAARSDYGEESVAPFGRIVDPLEEHIDL